MVSGTLCPIIYHNKASSNIQHTHTIYETSVHSLRINVSSPWFEHCFSDATYPMTFINKNPTVETTFIRAFDYLNNLIWCWAKLTNVAIILAGTPFFKKSTLVR